jgi:hypothetical protein
MSHEAGINNRQQAVLAFAARSPRTYAHPRTRCARVTARSSAVSPQGLSVIVPAVAAGSSSSVRK